MRNTEGCVSDRAAGAIVVAFSDLPVEVRSQIQLFGGRIILLFPHNSWANTQFPSYRRFIHPFFVLYRAVSALDLNPEPSNSILHRLDTDHTESTMRIDLEPSWQEDPRTVSSMVRCQRVPVTTLNIPAFL